MALDIEDYALIGNTRTTALVGNVGSINFLAMNARRTAYTVTKAPWDDPWTEAFTTEIDAAQQIALEFA